MFLILSVETRYRLLHVSYSILTQANDFQILSAADAKLNWNNFDDNTLLNDNMTTFLKTLDKLPFSLTDLTI